MRETRSQRFTSGGVGFNYGPLGRLYQIYNGTEIRRFVYAPDDSGTPEPIAEYDGNDRITQLYAWGAGPNEPLIWWDGAAGFAQRNLQADERGSIVAVTDAGGNPVNINRYDEYGIPASGNAGPFQYTGQLWLPEVGLYYYKNRFYSPTAGRFLQTDPIGQADNPNPYAYVHNDPVNMADPLGLASAPPPGPDCSLESNWRDGNCADDAVAEQVKRLTEERGGTSGQAAAETQAALDYLHGRTDLAGFVNALVSSGQFGPQFGGGDDFQLAQNSVTVRLPMAHPPGYSADPLDPSGRQVIDQNGDRVLNPLYQDQINNTHFNYCGIAGNLLIGIGGGVSIFGPVGAAAGQVISGAGGAMVEVCHG